MTELGAGPISSAPMSEETPNTEGAEASKMAPAATGMEPLVNVRPTRHFTREKSDRKWVLVDAKGQRVGRLATRIATILRGKHKPTFTPHDDVGDFVVVINAAEVVFRGNEKAAKKRYYKHTGYMGHLKTRTAEEMLARSPHKVVQLAVWGMLPRGALANRLIKKLKVYSGSNHPHRAQQPEPIELGA